MSISFVLDGERRRIHTTLEGSVSVDEVAEWFSADVRRAAGLAGAVSREQAMAPRALVVSSTAAFGMARMLSVLFSSRMAIEVFRDLAAGEGLARGRLHGRRVARMCSPPRPRRI